MVCYRFIDEFSLYSILSLFGTRVLCATTAKKRHRIYYCDNNNNINGSTRLSCVHVVYIASHCSTFSVRKIICTYRVSRVYYIHTTHTRTRLIVKCIRARNNISNFGVSGVPERVLYRLSAWRVREQTKGMLQEKAIVR